MHFDGTITLGNVLTIAAFAFAALLYGLRLDSRIKANEEANDRYDAWILAHEACNKMQISTLNKINESLSYLRGVSDAQRQRDGDHPQLKDRY